MAAQDATEIGTDRRWASAAWWGGLVVLAGVVVGRLTDSSIPYVLGVAAGAAIVATVLRTRPAVVTRDEVRLPRRTIRREDVASVTRADDSTALVFRDRDGRIVGLADVFELSGTLREALRRHGWPVVDAPA